jgi:hypothetical protein
LFRDSFAAPLQIPGAAHDHARVGLARHGVRVDVHVCLRAFLRVVTMRRVILETPYAGNIDANVAYARSCVRDCLLRGESPIASHLLYTQPGVLRDEVPAERQLGIAAGLAWITVADATVVYTDLGISPGMMAGIQAASLAGRPVEYRTLPIEKESAA